MKIIYTLALMLSLVALSPTVSHAQLKRDIPGKGIQDASSSLISSPSTTMQESLFNALLDPEHFRMSHSYSVQYNSLLNNTVGEYVNTMTYAFDIPLMIRADIGLMHQPFGVSNKQKQYGFGSDAFSGVYLKNLSMTYQPFKNLWMGISFQRYNASDINPFFYHPNRWSLMH